MHASMSCLRVWVGRLRIHLDTLSSKNSQKTKPLRAEWMEKKSRTMWVCGAESEVWRAIISLRLAPLDAG